MCDSHLTATWQACDSRMTANIRGYLPQHKHVWSVERAGEERKVWLGHSSLQCLQQTLHQKVIHCWIWKVTTHEFHVKHFTWRLLFLTTYLWYINLHVPSTHVSTVTSQYTMLMWSQLPCCNQKEEGRQRTTIVYMYLHEVLIYHASDAKMKSVRRQLPYNQVKR